MHYGTNIVKTRCKMPVLLSLFVKTWRTPRTAFGYSLSQPCTGIYSEKCSFGFLTFAFEFLGRDVAELNWLLHPLERHRDGGVIAVIQRVEQVDASDGTPTAMVKVPPHQLTLVAPGFLLNRVVKDQHPIVKFNRSDGRFDLRPQVLGGVRLCG
jgi:hypothetical protein